MIGRAGLAIPQASFPDVCRISGANDEFSWPASGLLSTADFCRIEFVKPLVRGLFLIEGRQDSKETSDKDMENLNMLMWRKTWFLSIFSVSIFFLKCWLFSRSMTEQEIYRNFFA